jgi:hypothetical protein
MALEVNPLDHRMGSVPPHLSISPTLTILFEIKKLYVKPSIDHLVGCKTWKLHMHECMHHSLAITSFLKKEGIHSNLIPFFDDRKENYLGF